MHKSILKYLRELPPINPAGHVFVVVFFLLALLLDHFSIFFGWIGLLLTAWCAYFFRDPERVVPNRPGVVVSPADGRVVAVEEITPPAELGLGAGKRLRLSIFLNVFDVHVNRVPAEGEIVAAHYVPGQFLNAELDKASEKNERMLLTVKRPDGVSIGFVQIAGMVARRIVCHVKVGDQVLRGQRFGLIRFGSRMDIYLPAGTESLVLPGQRAIAGETVLANVPERKKA